MWRGDAQDSSHPRRPGAGAGGADAFPSGSRHAVRAELYFYAGRHGKMPSVLAGLAAASARQEVLSTVETYHRASVGPHWRGIRAHLDAERARRGTVMLDRIDSDPSMDGDFVLDGRGLVLMPSFFLRPPAGALGNLLGRTRASVLTAIADGVTTTGALAGRLDISAAAVSQHTAMLREAGLITTRRHHGNVLHHPTQTGLTLLNRPDR